MGRPPLRFQLYSDLGTPANYRQMDGSSVHAFKFVNAKGLVEFSAVPAAG